MTLTRKKHHKKNNKSKKFKKLNCSPKQDLDFSCYSPKQLYKLKLNWNKKNPTKKIKSNNPKKIWESLQKKNSKKCTTEKCWLSQEFMYDSITEDLRKTTFAPKAPDSWRNDPNTWLNSTDINNIMSQYESKFKYFKFIGPSPIDFDKKKHFGNCVWNDLCNFSLKDYIRKGISIIGIIWNTDPHNEPGEHWICMIINIKNKYIYFFDSNADDLPLEVKKFQNKIKLQGDALNIKFKIRKNKKRHQYENAQCGMYCLYIITSVVKNPDHTLEFKNRITDDQMKSLRKKFYN